MRYRESFNEAAELYDEVRPSYPNELIEWIIKESKLETSDNLLEIAPGTGQCTKKFAERGYTIHAVELGNNLAELLLHNMKQYPVTVDVAPFEEWISPHHTKYKLIYCATAWHWIEPDVKYQKTVDLLEDNGRLAIIWNNALGLEDNHLMDKAYDLLFSYHKETPHSIKPKRIEEIKTQSMSTTDVLQESGHFIQEGYYEQTWSLKEPKEKLIKGFFSQSSYLSLNDADKDELKEKLTPIFEQLDNEIESYFKSVVYLLRKNPK